MPKPISRSACEQLIIKSVKIEGINDEIMNRRVGINTGRFFTAKEPPHMF
jgi:hypothetical protein